MFKKTEEISNLFDCFQKKRYVAVNLYSSDKDVTTSVEEALRSELGEGSIFIDIADKDSFESFIEEFVEKLLAMDENMANGNNVNLAEYEGDVRLFRRYTGRLLGRIIANNGWFKLVLSNFDVAAKWDNQSFAWMRELVDGGKIPVCIILSEKSLPQISDKPEDSSPFHNVFRNYALQREEN